MLAPLLRPHFTLVMVELPGIGKSPMTGGDYLSESVDALERLRLSLGFESWDVLGYSIGSRVAESYVRIFAAHVGRVIFLCPLRVGLIKTLSIRFALWTDSLIPAIGNFVLNGWRLRFLILLLGFNLHPDPNADEWFDLITSQPVAALRANLRMAAKLSREKFQAPVPFALIWGSQDLITATPHKQTANEYFVKSNHAMPVLAAHEISKIVLEFLKK